MWNGLSPEARLRVKVFALSALPVAELRGGIPLGVGSGMPWREAFLVAAAGNLAPVIPLLFALGPMTRFLERWAFARRVIEAVFARTRRRSGLIERYEAIGLALFVAVPLPMTGAWTGVLAAHLLGVRPRYAVPAVVAGVVIAGVIVTLASQGVLHLWRL
ncbi:MAG: small multi-drug export protein [Candidatus Eisenbacteria bacterium]|nr:small multi-drug export protein [Candidatus Eisenbacteria bacterium]